LILVAYGASLYSAPLGFVVLGLGLLGVVRFGSR